MEGVKYHFKGEGTFETSAPLFRGRDSVAHPFGDTEQRLVAIRGRERAAAEPKARFRVAELYIVEACGAPLKNRKLAHSTTPAELRLLTHLLTIVCSCSSFLVASL
jgi:hypothetical protein